MKYAEDQQFTDKVHAFALKHIYNNLGWQEDTIGQEEVRKWADQNIGFDYVFKTAQNRRIYIQERFRDKKYAQYNDFTLRYMREENPREERRLSEFFKIKADYLVYGIIDKSKEEVLRHQDIEIGFVKYLVVNLRVLMDLAEQGLIEISRKVRECTYEKGVLLCPVKLNYDRSSSFVVFDIEKLCRLIHDNRIGAGKLFLHSQGYKIWNVLETSH